VVTIDYFTKWIGTKPLVNIVSTVLKKFLRQSIICQFGVLRKITVGIKASFTSVYHPQSNGVVE
jgi:hypothetical protein